MRRRSLRLHRVLAGFDARLLDITALFLEEHGEQRRSFRSG